jgi:catecholate siderophore receptor
VLGAAFTASAAAALPAMAAPPAQAQPGAASAGSAAPAAAVHFEIAAGPLAGAMTQFSAATGIRVTILTNGIGELQSPGVRGTMTARQALQQLLNGTGVSSAFTAATAVALDLRPLTETVSVTGEATKVASPKFVESLRDTPVTVVVVPQQVFQEQNATSLREALRNTPGITMSIGEGGSGGTSSGDNVMIRGFSARNDIYIDGARDVGLVSRDMFNTG